MTSKQATAENNQWETVRSPARGERVGYTCAHMHQRACERMRNLFFFFFIELSASIYDPLMGNKHQTSPPTSRSRLRRAGLERAFRSRPHGDTIVPLAPLRFAIWPHGGGSSQVRPTMQGHPAVTPLGNGAPHSRNVESHCQMRYANGRYQMSGNISSRDKTFFKPLPKRGKSLVHILAAG